MSRYHYIITYAFFACLSCGAGQQAGGIDIFDVQNPDIDYIRQNYDRQEGLDVNVYAIANDDTTIHVQLGSDLDRIVHKWWEYVSACESADIGRVVVDEREFSVSADSLSLSECRFRVLHNYTDN